MEKRMVWEANFLVNWNPSGTVSVNVFHIDLDVVLSHKLFCPFRPLNMTPAIAERDEQRYIPILRPTGYKAHEPSLAWKSLISGDGLCIVIFNAGWLKDMGFVYDGVRGYNLVFKPESNWSSSWKSC